MYCSINHILFLYYFIYCNRLFYSHLAFLDLMKTSFVEPKYWANKFVNLCCPISLAFNFKPSVPPVQALAARAKERFRWRHDPCYGAGLAHFRFRMIPSLQAAREEHATGGGGLLSFSPLACPRDFFLRPKKPPPAPQDRGVLEDKRK